MREERVAVQEADKEEEEVEADEDAVEMTESVSREYTIYTIQWERVRNSVDKRLRHHGL